MEMESKKEMEGKKCTEKRYDKHTEKSMQTVEAGREQKVRMIGKEIKRMGGKQRGRMGEKNKAGGKVRSGWRGVGGWRGSGA
jgi:hypothetical protein